MTAAAPDPRARLRRRLLTLGGVAAIAFFAVHAGAPALAGIERSLELVRSARPGWIVAAGLCTVASFACYIAMFRSVVAYDRPGVGWRGSYSIAMASLAASTVVTAGGAGGIALIAWALGRHGLDARRAGERLVAFLTFHYVVYLLLIAVFGFALWGGALPGPAPLSLTLVPAIVCVLLLVLGWAVSRRPGRSAGARVPAGSAPQGGRITQLRSKLAALPQTIRGGLHEARARMTTPERAAGLGLLAVAYWATNIAALGCCFLAFGATPSIGGLVLGFFVGLTANLLPLLPGGIGSVEAGLIGALIAFGEPGAAVVVSVLAYRLVNYWLPTILEAVAYVQLRRSLPPAGDPARRDGRPASAGGAPADDLDGGATVAP